MTKKVYILTREGKGYTDKGLEFLTNHIVLNLKESADLEFIGGGEINKSDLLIKQLEKHPDCYVIISDIDEIVYISGRNISVFHEALLADPESTSWEVARKAHYIR